MSVFTKPIEAGSLKYFVMSAVLCSASGCLFVVDDNQPGEIEFSWSFAGEIDCATARVDEIDVEIVDDQGTRVHEDTVACNGTGLRIDDFAPGTYRVFLDAYDDRDTHLFAGEKADEVVGGRTNDFGTITLVDADELAPGDLAFYWLFDDEPSCAAAGVDEVDVLLSDENDGAVVDQTVTCSGGGLVLTELPPGNYDLSLDAYSDDNHHLFAGSFAVTVVAGVETDVGDLNLSVVPNDDGTLRVRPAFLYPNTALETGCIDAGVVSFRIDVVEEATQLVAFSSSYPCISSAALIEITPLSAGAYVVVAEAFGLYDGMPLSLYVSGDVEVDVDDGQTVEVNPLPLTRVTDNFANIDVQWTLPDTCAATGITLVDVTIERYTSEGLFEEDTFTDDPCQFMGHLRQTFVPGMYRVTGETDGGEYSAVVDVEVAPRTSSATATIVNLALAEQ